MGRPPPLALVCQRYELPEQIVGFTDREVLAVTVEPRDRPLLQDVPQAKTVPMSVWLRGRNQNEISVTFYVTREATWPDKIQRVIDWQDAFYVWPSPVARPDDCYLCAWENVSDAVWEAIGGYARAKYNVTVKWSAGAVEKEGQWGGWFDFKVVLTTHEDFDVGTTSTSKLGLPVGLKSGPDNWAEQPDTASPPPRMTNEGMVLVGDEGRLTLATNATKVPDGGSFSGSVS